LKGIELPQFRPRMKVLDRDQAWAIHEAALEILERIGFRMEHRGAQAMLLEAGCRADGGDWLRMPPHLVEEALASAPKRIAVFDQNGHPAMSLSQESFYYGTGSDTLFTLDLESFERRRALLRDTANFARLVDALPNLSFAMSMSNPQDAPLQDLYVCAFAEMVRSTSKPIVFIAEEVQDVARIHEIACLVAGGREAFEARPFILHYSEAISPLRFPEGVMAKVLFCAQNKIPICFPSGSNAGGGAPVTLAGALSLGIAENLVGLVVHQLAGKGSPFVFGPNVSALDMNSTVVSYGCPEWSLTQAALADMRDLIYHLPIWAFAGATDAKLVDAQAGAEAMFSVITAMLGRANLIHDVGYMEYGTTSSLEMVVMVDELIGMSRHFAEGIPVNRETLALEAIERVAKGGAGSMFLTDEHTFDHFRGALFRPRLLDRSRFDRWAEAGKTDLFQRCNQEARRLIAEHRPRVLPPEVLREIERIARGVPA
jgi:trimethylamine--corrinoid protein Co-methyltransferase